MWNVSYVFESTKTRSNRRIEKAKRVSTSYIATAIAKSVDVHLPNVSARFATRISLESLI